MEEVIIECECPLCKQLTYIKVDKDGFFKWKKGELVQRAFPKLSIEERECLISNICLTCQDEMFE